MRTLLAALVLAAAPALAAPTVSLTSPSNGALYLAPGTLPVKANASASGVGINRVEFYANGTLINTDSASPYQFDWTGVAAGSYAITAKAIDNNGAETTSAPRSITVAGTNTPPTVSLSAPADNVRYLNPPSVTLTATAAGPELNDIIQSVAFYLNGSLAQTITQAPFSYGATGLAAGPYTLTAVATDSQGAQTTSAPRTFIVSGTNLAPTVSLVIPQDNSKWNAPATVTFQASVNSGEANDTVSVEFFANGASLGTRSSVPWSLSTSLAANTYAITAVATDGQGAQTTSTARTIVVSDTNLAPTIGITSPASGANFPTAPAAFAFSATAGAGEVNGWVTKVEFYVNGSLINTDTAGPFSYNVSGLANGSYQLTAKAIDQLGGETTTAPITVTVGSQPKLHFIHVDHLNTPRLVADSAGVTVWRWDQQEPFGNNPPDENPSSLGIFDLPLRFAGQRYDAETGLHYNYFRDYDPTLGIYKQSDPIGLRSGLNTFAYVVGDPLQYDDRLGLEPGSLRQRGYPPSGPEFCFLAGSLTGEGGLGYPHYFNCVNGNCGGFYPGVGGDLKGERGVPGVIKNDSADYGKAVCRVVETMCDQQKFLECMADRVRPAQQTYVWKFIGRNCRANAESDILDCRRFSCSRTSDLQL